MTASVAVSRRRRLWQELIGPDTRFVLIHFVLSRLIILAGGALTSMLLAADGRQELIPLLSDEGVQEGIRRLFVAGDANWYMRVVTGGYEAIPFSAAEQHNWAFFPLYPLIVIILGGTVDAGVIAANAFALVAARVLIHEVRDFESATVARWTILFVLYWPFSVMLSAFRPESLLLLFAVLAWAFARRGHWWLAWAAIALATLTRSQGLLTVLLLIDPIWAQREAIRRHPWPLILGAALPVLALGAFSLHLWDLTGDPLAWSHIQAAWGRQGLDPIGLVQRYWPLLFSRQDGWDWSLMGMLVVAFLGLATLLMLRVRRIGFATFTVAWVALPVLFGPTLIAIGRYANALFPVAITIASARSLRRYRLLILLVMAALLFGVGVWLSMGFKSVSP